MPELEPKILAWRLKLLAALPGDVEIVDELEDHLRESIAALHQKGTPIEEAFMLASASIGQPKTIALQFHHLKSRHSNPMKFVRIVITIPLGLYLVAMGGQVLVMAIDLFKEGLSPYSPAAPAAFFPNLLACSLSLTAIALL